MLGGWDVDKGGVARVEKEKTEATMKRLNHVRRIMKYFFITPNFKKMKKNYEVTSSIPFEGRSLL